MAFLKRYYWAVSLSLAVALGMGFFITSYRRETDLLTAQWRHTLQVVTNVKLRLLERKLYTIEQQLALLSQNKVVTKLLTTPSKRGEQTDSQFDEYVKSLLYNQGCSDMLLVSRSGDLVYAFKQQGEEEVHLEISQFAQGEVTKDSAAHSTVVLREGEPHFHVGRHVLDADGNTLGALFVEVPKEFLSVELSNTVSRDALTSYLVSPYGIIDQAGLVDPDTCTSCKWNDDAFISYSSDKKISGTWSLLSVYPVSQIEFRHAVYVSALDGMIAFFAAVIIILVIVYSMQAIQKSKGITGADTLLVQTSWNAVSEYSIKIIAGFYKHLFASAPEVKPLFKSNQAVQEKRMALMINTIVNSVDSLEEFKGSITQLAKNHVHMGVKREYFPVVVNALINSVGDQYGAGFSSAHRKAWLKILNRVSSIMIEEMEAYQRTMNDPASRKEGEPVVHG